MRKPSVVPPQVGPGMLPDEIVEGVADGVIVVDGDWRYRYVNAAAERFVGKTRRDLLGRTIWEAFPALLGSDVEREYRRALADGVQVHFEYFYDPLDSWFDIRADPSADGLAIHLRVINERKALEQGLAARVRQQEAIAGMGQQILRAGRVEDLLEEVARVVAEMLDVEYAKVLRLLPDGRDFVLEAGWGWTAGVGQVIVPGNDDSQAGFTLRQGGSVVVTDLPTETRFHGPALLVDHGVKSGMSVVIEGLAKPYGILGAHTTRRRTFSQHDVNFLQAMANLVAEAVERQAAAAALRSSEEQFRELAENIREVLWMQDPRSGELLYANPAYEEVWGRSVQSVYDDSASWREAIHPDDRAAVEAALPDLVDGEFNMDFRVVRPDGTERWIHDHAFPVRGPDGRVMRVVGIAEDVTERREAMDAALRLAEERAAHAADQAALEARDRTLAVVAHDLRTPLQAILGCASLLQEPPGSPAGRQSPMEIIRRSVKRALRLLDDLLDVSRIQGGHMVLERQEVALQALFRDVRHTFLEGARQRGVQLSSGACQGAAVRADEQRLFQVLCNLVDNALKHTAEGDSITLGCAAVGDMVELSVADTGPGIPADELPHLFEWYWQAPRERAVGAGIGLAVAKGVVEAHGGRIWVDSGPGRGTVFRLTVPIS